ncbi:hypothetical protein ACGFW5_23610 [Streptomyces sp. NPDC048416]|uniref:hypothetical protein n=1 Tax=Streptomyces sp. NPDC048416 TaxID=3365546 RepID=UPI003714DAF0
MTAPEDRSIPENGTGEDHGTTLIGVRPHDDVDLALEYLTARSEAPAQFALGVAAAYRWSMGRSERSPVTGTAVRRPPDLPLLTAEVDAAVVQLEDPTSQAGARDFTRGVHDGLAWVCGYSDRRI